MNLINTVGWALVELQGSNPNLESVRLALEKSLCDAARLEIERDLRTDGMLRMAQVGGY